MPVEPPMPPPYWAEAVAQTARESERIPVSLINDRESIVCSSESNRVFCEIVGAVPPTEGSVQESAEGLVAKREETRHFEVTKLLAGQLR